MNVAKLQIAGTHSAVVARLCTALLALFLSGCLTIPTTPIEAENTSAFQKAVRASFNMNGGERSAAEVRSGHAIEIGYQGTKVSSGQSLASGQSPLILNGTTFTGPDQLSNQFDFSYTDIAWRMREFGGSQFGLELLAGLAQTSLGITVTSPTQQAVQHFTTTGLQVGFGPIWRINASSSLHARATYYLALDTGASSATKYELYYAYALHRNLSLHAGYTDWKVEGTGGSGMSDFKLHIAGPAILLDWNFNLGN